MNGALFPIHARTLTGLENGLAEELRALGALDIQVETRVVLFRGDLRMLYKANLWCRTAIRVLRPLATFAAPDENALYEGIRGIDWAPWLTSPTGSLAVNANVYSSFTTHSLFLAQLAKDAIVDQMRERTGDRPSVDLENPDLRIVVGLFQNMAQVYVDASGDSLHRRGYRLAAGDAPISETLAAGILRLSGWDGTRPFLDPMCGSGTFPIEAGLLLRNIAPGLLRKSFGFQRWADYDAALYESLIAEAKASVREVSTPIVGLELDPTVAEIARQNVARAGLSDVVQIYQGDFFSWRGELGPAGTLVLNPPYDERLSIDNVGEFYQRMGDRLKEAYSGWTAYVLSGNLGAMKYVGLRSARRTELYNGSIECRLFQFELGEGAQPAVRERTTIAEENPRWMERAEVFANRLRKNLKHYSKWARREGVNCWRVYDWDIPELPFLLDLYGDRLHFAEVPRNIELSPLEHASYLQLLLKTASTVLGIAPEKTYFKKRKPMKTGGAHSPLSEAREFFEVTEGGHRFLVNLADFMDGGLFLDQRKIRAWVQKEAAGKDFLNLYSYTGSLSVYAAAGGAKSTVSVDTASTYLEWAQENLRLNGLSGAANRLIRSDAVEFLERSSGEFDLCVVDPPVRSVNRASGQVFDVRSDHVALLQGVLARVRPGGKVLFCTSFRGFELDGAVLGSRPNLRAREVTSAMTSLDFERKPGHKCWLIEV